MRSKPTRWSPHALKNLADREIPRSEAESALVSPELVEPVLPARKIFTRRYFDSRLQQQMLVRVVAEEMSDEVAVITVYITSKIDKYMKRVRP